MDEHHENDLRHTKLFVNKNLLHCYHNNRGYCSFGDKCKYRHFQETCDKTICRERACVKRHPVICRYKEKCKFYKLNSCAFKHIEIKNKIPNKDIETELEMLTNEMITLKSEINDLKNVLNVKEKELLESKVEIEQLNSKLALGPSDQHSDVDIMIRENDELKEKVKILEKENEAMKIRLVQKGKTHDTTVNEAMKVNLEQKVKTSDKHSVIQSDVIKMTMKSSCKKCCLNFSSKEKLDKHKGEMHKETLTF